MPKSSKRTRQEEVLEAARMAEAAAAAASGASVEMPPLGGGGAGTGTAATHPHDPDMNAIAVAVANDVAAGEMIAGLDAQHQHQQHQQPHVHVPPTKRSRLGHGGEHNEGMEVDPIAHADLLQYAPAQAGSTKRSETWFNHFERLKAFREQTGHFHLPKKDPLSQWARDQRTQKSKQDKGVASTLTAERKTALESIGFPWRLWTKRPWDDRIADLEAFRQQNGHCDVPIRRGEPQSLATWVDEQRKLYRQKHNKGKRNALSDEREAQLSAMGFSWYRYGPTSWAERVADLKRYKATHGDCLVPLKHKNEKDSEWKRLANWVSFQRLQYKKLKKGDKTTLMTEERRQELADLGFVFSVKDDNPRSNWNNMLDELYRYKSTHANSCDVPSDYEGNRRLAAWVRYVRDLYARKQAGEEDVVGLSDDHINVLEGVGFQWTTSTDDAALASQIDCSAFYAEFAKEDAAEAAAPPHEGKVSAGFTRNDEAWNARLGELKAYKAAHNTCNVAWKSKTAKNIADPAIVTLGKWVSKQRSEYKKFQKDEKSQITEERIAALDALGFEWSPGTMLVDWSVRYQQLIEYKNEHHNTNVPKSYTPAPALGQWVQTQRVYYKKWKQGKKTHLTDERRQKLDDIGFQWQVGNARPRGAAGFSEPNPDDIAAEAAAMAAASVMANV